MVTIAEAGAGVGGEVWVGVGFLCVGERVVLHGNVFGEKWSDSVLGVLRGREAGSLILAVGGRKVIVGIGMAVIVVHVVLIARLRHSGHVLMGRTTTTHSRHIREIVGSGCPRARARARAVAVLDDV